MFRALWFGRNDSVVCHSQNAAFSSLVLSAVPHDAIIPGPGTEYGDQLFDNHYVAGLRRREHDDLLQPDGGTLCPELFGGRCGVSRGHRLHPWARPPTVRHAR